MGDHVRSMIRNNTKKNTLPELARARLAARRAANPQKYTESLMDCIPRGSPNFVRPEPLFPLVNMIERTATERVFGIGATPPQHGKTICIATSLAWLCRKVPGRQHAYATYSQARARSVSMKAERIFDRLGIRREGTLDQWYMPDFDTVIFWTSIGGKLTGEGITGTLFVDDAYKDRQEACSPAYQLRSMDWYDDVADTRLNPGSSMLVIAARWDQNDMSGQLLKRANPLGKGDPWEECNLKAIYEGDGPEGDDREVGEALWPDRKPLIELEQKRSSSSYTFASLYQGSPRPRGGALFGEPTYYDEMPMSYRVGLGTDLAYSKKTSADWSVLFEIRRCDNYFTNGQNAGKAAYFITKVDRAQVKAPEFALTLRAGAARHPGTNIYWYASGVETGAGDFLVEKGIPLVIIPPPGDKYSRALSMAEAWNEGRVMLPSSEYIDKTPGNFDWVVESAYEICNFTGVSDAHDDIVDSGVSAFDAVSFGDPDLDIQGGASSRR